MKILILVQSCKLPPYDEFLKAQQETWDSIHHPNVETVFYQEGATGWQGNVFSGDSVEDYYWMHWKFKVALDAVWDKDWDIIFRTNSSAYVDKEMLYNTCFGMPIRGLYAGWRCGDAATEIEWEGGKVNGEFVSGAGMFISRDVADILRHELPNNESIEEDVLAARILQKHGITCLFDDRRRVDIWAMDDYRQSYHYRFKTPDRVSDIERIRLVHAAKELQEMARKHTKVGLLIPTYNRPEYLKECMESVCRLNWMPDFITIVDDISDNPEVLGVISDFHEHFWCQVIFKIQKTGIRGSVRIGSEDLFGRGADLVIVLDSDAIVKPDMVERLVKVHSDHNCISSGFNCSSENKPVLERGDGVVFKGWCNGINMCYSKAEYDTYISPTLAVEGNWDDNTSRNYQLAGKRFVVTTPSVVQHIGMVSAMGHYPPDVASDF